MQSNPLVSVLMPVYNGGEYLAPAIDSILNQTYKNFEFIIINDCSTDNSLNVIEDYAKKDERIKVLVNNPNRGISNTLNRGIEESEGVYIVIMHSDDIAMDKRLQDQILYLEQNPDISILGTNYYALGPNKTICFTNTPISCKHMLLLEDILCHPSVTMRKADILNKNLRYRKEYDGAEDYKLWTEAAALGLKINNLNETLLKYRIHETQTSCVKALQIENMATQIKAEYARALLGDFLTDEEVEFVTTNKMFSLNKLRALIAQIREWNKNNPNLTIEDVDYLSNKKTNWMLKKAYFKDALQIQDTKSEKLKLYQLYIKRSINKLF